MSLPSDVYACLKGLCDGRVYPDVTPETPVFPLIVYQQVGGSAYEYLDQSLPQRDHARVQVLVWSRTRAEADAIARQVRQAILATDWPAQTMGAPISIYQDGTDLYGSRQDFGVWHLP